MSQSHPPGERLFTLPELTEQVKSILGPAYPVSAWARELPSETTIRYYRSLGLVDPPAQKRGRVALYSDRHLSQIVATKRLQATGLLLDEIRRRLSGMKPAQLHDVIVANPPFSVVDPTAGSGSFVMAASELRKNLSRRHASAARSSEVRTEKPVVWMTTGSGKTHTFIRLLQEAEKRGRLSRKVPVRIAVAPEIEVTVIAHLSKALTHTLSGWLREHFQAAPFWNPIGRSAATVPSAPGARAPSRASRSRAADNEPVKHPQ